MPAIPTTEDTENTEAWDGRQFIDSKGDRLRH